MYKRQEQNQVYWKQFDSALVSNDLISEYLDLEKDLQLPESEILLSNFTELDASDLLGFFKQLQEIDFPLSYQHMYEYFQKRERYEAFRKALEHLNKDKTIPTTAAPESVDLSSLESFSQIVKALAISIKGGFSVFQDELKPIKLRWGDKYLPRAGELESLSALLNEIEKHSGLLAGKESKKKREEAEHALEQDRCV